MTTKINHSLVSAFFEEGDEPLGDLVAALLMQRYKVNGVASYHLVGPSAIVKRAYRILEKGAPAVMHRVTAVAVHRNRFMRMFGRGDFENVTRKEFENGSYS